jgi:uncharacterized delta-60 repeat protein
MFRFTRPALLVLAAALTLCACGGEEVSEEPIAISEPAAPLPATSPVQPPAPPPTQPITEIGAPTRLWSLEARNAFDKSRILATGTSESAVDIDSIAGGVVIVPAGFDRDANVEAFSSASGKTYWVSAEAPHGAADQPDTTNFGATSLLIQAHWYRKETASAKLELVVSAVDLQVIDHSDWRTHPNVCPWVPSGTLDHPRCFDQVSATVEMDVLVLDDGVDGGPCRTEQDGRTCKVLDWYSGASQITGYNSRWLWNPAYLGSLRKGMDNLTAKPIFRPNQFSSSVGFVPDIITTGQDGRLTLAQDSVLQLDLSSVPERGQVAVVVIVRALAHDRQAREAYARAMLRDPVRIGGVVVNSTGLSELKPPTTIPAAGTASLPECAAPVGEAYPSTGGVVQFGSPSYLVAEFEQTYATIFVERAGSSQGTHIVTVSSTDGTARAGSEYEAFRQTIVFHDGDDVPRAIRIPVNQDARATGDTQLTLSLSAQGNCGRIGNVESTLVTIVDDDQRPAGGGLTPPTPATLGGTVSGLAGSGLVLQERINLLDLPITHDGSFVFNREYPANAAYDVVVRTNPSNPTQICRITNGTGTSAGTPITNVAVTCETPAPAGALDPTFGSAGKAVDAVRGAADQIAVLADGKILARFSSVLTRYLSDGALDTSFGANGALSVVFDSATATRVNSFTVQPDGKILVTGAFVRTSLDNDIAVARFNADGSPDTTFGAGGKTYVVRSGSFEQGVVSLVQSDGRIVVASNADVPPPGLFGYSDFGVLRLNANGSVDTAFGTADGRTVVDIGGRTDIVTAAVLQPDDRVIVTGRVASSGGENPDIGIARFNADGTLDTTFGTSGKVRLDVDGSGEWDEPTAMALQTDARILIAMQSKQTGVAYPFSVARFEPNGSLDATFGTAGVARTPIGSGNALSNGVAIQSDGKIVLVGQVPSATVNDFGVVRYLPNGAIDTSFDGDGILTVDFFADLDAANDVAIQPNGRIVVGGTARNGTALSLTLIRVLP